MQKLCELIKEAGSVYAFFKHSCLYHHTRYPDGVLNCVPSLGRVGGAALASHVGVDKVHYSIYPASILTLIDQQSGCFHWVDCYWP